MQRTERTFCRICHLNCSLFVEMDGDTPVKVYGDKDNPVYHGFSCIKGREMVAYHTLPSRLLRPQKRDAQGKYRDIAYEQATREIAAKITQLVKNFGPRSVACYGGTPGANLVTPNIFAQSFLAAIESPMWFTSLTIDQPGKFLAKGLLGDWAAGMLPFDDLDVQVVVGNNPPVSLTGFGIASAHNLKNAKARGMKLIVVDPRVSESARKADVHLQAIPGEDAAIMAGLLHVIIAEQRYDNAFVRNETSGFDALKAAVTPFTPDYVAQRAGISRENLIAAARLYAGARKGGVTCGTGPNMSGHGMLVEYLGRVLMTLCGHWPRAGETTRHPGLYFDHGEAIAGTRGPYPAWGFGEKLRIRGFTNTLAGLPTAALSDEILTPGEGQIKALIVVGGNPMAAIPNQLKTLDALKSLELLVCLDPQMAATSRLAHYVIPPKMALETEAFNLGMEWLTTAQMASGFGSEIPYGQHTPPLMMPPEDSDLREEWEFFYDVAREMGKPLVLKPISNPWKSAELAVTLDMKHRPTVGDIWAAITRGSPLPLDEIKQAGQGGHIFDLPARVVAPKPDDWVGRLDVGNSLMLAEMATVAAEDLTSAGPSRAFRLTVRRMVQFHNSAWMDRGPIRIKRSYNPAFMHPDDVRDLGAASGDVIEIESDRAVMKAIVEPDPKLRRGCVSICHNWGPNPDEAQDPTHCGSAVNRLTDDERDFDPYSGIPIMSALPVDIRKLMPVANRNLEGTAQFL